MPAAPSTFILGEDATIDFTFGSIQPGVYPAASDSCEIGGLVQETTSAFVSLSGTTATVATLDGSDPKADEVGSETIIFSFTSPYTSDYFSETYNFEVRPACYYSTIVFDTYFFPLTLGTSVSYPLILDESDVYHIYDDVWAARGYPNVCTLELTLSGAATSFSTVTGLTVDIAPLEATPIGINELTITAGFTYSEYEDPIPTNKNIAKSFNIVIQRSDEIETWPMYTIWGLGWANFALAVISLYFFCDATKEKGQQYKKTEAKWPTYYEALNNTDIDIIIMQ